jgi:hypothetical protein
LSTCNRVPHSEPCVQTIGMHVWINASPPFPSFAACTAAKCATCAAGSATTCAACVSDYTLNNGRCSLSECRWSCSQPHNCRSAHVVGHVPSVGVSMIASSPPAGCSFSSPPSPHLLTFTSACRQMQQVQHARQSGWLSVQQQLRLP